MEVRNIIWDFDGTLFDTYSAIVKAFSSILEEKYHLSINTSRIYELVKVDTKYCAEILATENHINQQELLISARDAYNYIDFNEQYPFKYVREICNRIDQAGGNNFLVTHRDGESLDAILTTHGFSSVFTDIVSSEDGFAQKPSPDSFNYLIGKNKLELNGTCGAGDRELDVLAANAAGIFSVYFCPHGGMHSKADKNISSFSGLLDLIA